MAVEISYNGLKAINDVIFKINSPLIGKRGLHYQKLLKDWNSIVGEKLSNLAIPIKISKIKHRSNTENVLLIATSNASIGIEVAYYIGVIKEQINIYFGYDLIQQIKIVQAAFSHQVKKKVSESPMSDDQVEQANDLIDSYNETDDIKAILFEMAKTIIQKS